MSISDFSETACGQSFFFGKPPVDCLHTGAVISCEWEVMTVEKNDFGIVYPLSQDS